MYVTSLKDWLQTQFPRNLYKDEDTWIEPNTFHIQFCIGTKSLGLTQAPPLHNFCKNFTTKLYKVVACFNPRDFIRIQNCVENIFGSIQVTSSLYKIVWRRCLAQSKSPHPYTKLCREDAWLNPSDFILIQNVLRRSLVQFKWPYPYTNCAEKVFVSIQVTSKVSVYGARCT